MEYGVLWTRIPSEYPVVSVVLCVGVRGQCNPRTVVGVEGFVRGVFDDVIVTRDECLGRTALGVE